MKHLVLALAFLLPHALAAQPASIQFEQTELRTLFDALSRQNIFNGNVLVADHDSVIFKLSTGVADVSTGRRLTDTSMFELASVSKQFTAMAIMILKERHQLSCEDSLRIFFPQLPYSGVTIRELLNHTSGIPDYMDLFQKKWDPKKIATNADLIALLAKYKPKRLFMPGSKFEYSNTGYVLLASILEKITGKTYGDFLRDNIFEPLGMHHTRVYNRRLNGSSISDYAYGYVYDRTRQLKLPDSLKEYRFVYYLDGIVGDATVNSTTLDLLTWDHALYTEKLLPKAALEEAFTRGVLKNGKRIDYGFGWEISRDPVLGKVISHDGSWPGYGTLIKRYVDAHKTAILLRNMKNSELLDFIFTDIDRILHGLEPHYTMKHAAIDPSLFKSYTGTYEYAKGRSMAILQVNGKLAVRWLGKNGAPSSDEGPGHPLREILPITPTRFFFRTVDAEIEFQVQGDKAKEVIVHQDGRDYRFRRVH